MLFALAVAQAHVGALLAGIDIDPRPPALLETSFGLLVEDEGWAWTCHEAVTTEDAVAVPAYHRSGSDLLAVVDLDQARDDQASVYRSVDGGCSWAVPADLDGREVADLSVGDDGVVVAVSSHPGYPSENEIWRSTDDGATWSMASVHEDLELSSVVVAGELTWATGQNSSGEQSVLSSDDGGATWRVDTLDVATWTESSSPVLRLAAARGDEAWLVLDALDGDTLLHVAEPGAAATAVLAVEGGLADVALDGDTLWVVEAQVALWTGHALGPLEVVVGAPESIGVAWGDELLLASYAETTGSLLFAGESFRTTLEPEGVAGPLACPDGSDHARICEPLYDQLRAALDSFDADPVDTDSDPASGGIQIDSGGASDGCGCRGGRDGLLWLAALALAGRRRGTAETLAEPRRARAASRPDRRNVAARDPDRDALPRALAPASSERP